MTAEDEMAEEVLSALHLNRSHPSKRPERVPDRHSLAPSALHTQNNPHCEMPVGKADKKFKQPQGTRVGGRVPETLGHRLIFFPPLSQNTLRHFSSNYQKSLFIARVSSTAQSSRFSSICFVLSSFQSFSLFFFKVEWL